MMESIFFISKVSPSKPLELKLNGQTPWLGDFLRDVLNEYELAEEGEAADAFMTFEGELNKKTHSKYGDYIHLSGTLRAKFLTLCVSSGKVIFDQLEAPINAVFLDEVFMPEFNLDEDVSVFLGEEEYDLYFYENRRFDIAPVIKEHFYLYKEPYPRSEEFRDSD